MGVFGGGDSGRDSVGVVVVMRKRQYECDRCGGTEIGYRKKEADTIERVPLSKITEDREKEMRETRVTQPLPHTKVWIAYCKNCGFQVEYNEWYPE